MLTRKMLSKLSNDSQIFRVAVCDVWFQDLENSMLAPTGRRVLPGKADDGADAGLREDTSLDFNCVRFDLQSKLPI